MFLFPQILFLSVGGGIIPVRTRPCTVDTNNDEWYFVEKYESKIVGGIITSVNVTPLYDVVITMDNGVRIELYINNGYHHFDSKHEQWVFFKRHDHSHPFITVFNKTVNIAKKC